MNIYKATRKALKNGYSIARKMDVYGLCYKVHILPTNTGRKCIRMEEKEDIPRWCPKAEDLVADDWIVIDGKRHRDLQVMGRLWRIQGTNICQATKVALKKGGSITRKNKYWKGLAVKPTNTDDGCILKIVEEGLTYPRWIPEAADLASTDWIVIME